MKTALSYKPVPFAELPDWDQDDHAAAFKAFLKSCERVVGNARERTGADKAPTAPAGLVGACTAASQHAGPVTRAAAKAFFERHFTANAVVHGGPQGLLTGYYEPLVEGSRTPQGAFQTPLYRRPTDLVNLVDETQRASAGMGLTHARRTDKGTEPFPTRAQIEQGALKNKNLELVYLADPVEVFFLQVQGSGRVKLPDGSIMRIHYDGKNGHPYSSIGRYLIEKGLLAADKVSMGALKQWLKADSERGKLVMWQNASYVFFRELKGAEAKGPLGAMSTPLTAGRSLAIDAVPPCPGPADLRQRRRHDPRQQGGRLQPADDRAGRRLGDQRSRARRYLLRVGGCCGPSRGRNQARGQVHRAAAERVSGAGGSSREQDRARESPAMSASGQKPRKTTERGITDDEAELWQHATRTLEQIKAKPRVAAGNASPPAPSRRAAPQAPAKTAPEKPPAMRMPERPAAPARKRPPAPLAEFERRKARQIASGKIEVDARVDLHGSHQRDAHARLRAFLMHAQAAGHKTVLVITGKGDAEQRGGSARPAPGRAPTRHSAAERAPLAGRARPARDRAQLHPSQRPPWRLRRAVRPAAERYALGFASLVPQRPPFGEPLSNSRSDDIPL